MRLPPDHPDFRHGKSGYARKCRCRECLDYALAYNRNWNARHKRNRKIANRKSNLKTRYGLTPERYDEMVAERDNRCDICGRRPPTDVSHYQDKLHVDHDHEAGRVRGLLCNQCNRAIGLLGDCPDRVFAAAEYLRKHG